MTPNMKMYTHAPGERMYKDLEKGKVVSVLN